MLEPLLESMPQAVTQLAFLAWRMTAIGKQFDLVIFSSLLASFMQVKHAHP